jgi:hypothetical protein
MIVLHGAAGALDEFLFVVMVFAVLGLAVYLSGRKSAQEGEEPVADEPVETAPSGAKTGQVRRSS